MIRSLLPNSFLWYCVSIGIILGFCFSPLYFHSIQDVPVDSWKMHFLLEHSPVDFYMACSACVAISIPLFFHFILDLVDGHQMSDSWERFIIFISLLAPKMFYIIYPNNECKLYYGFCLAASSSAIRVFMNILVPSKIASDLFLYTPSIFMYLMYLATLTLRLYAIIYPQNQQLEISVAVMYYSTLLLFLYISVHFIVKVAKKYHTVDSATRNRYLISLSHLSMPFCLAIGGGFLQLKFGDADWLDASEGFLTCQYILDTLVTMIFTVLPGRLARMEAMESQRILETKRTFVRFVSHEIRTPMNVVVAGLNIIQKMFPLCIENTKEFCSIISDVKSASLTAIDILNDLLNYEKIDEGMFDVNMSVFPLSGFFENNISSLRNYVSSKEIELSINDECNAVFPNKGDVESSPSGGGGDNSCRPIKIDGLEYFINVDRQCLEIVTRNILTNAVKFTSTGGSIVLSFRKKLQLPTNSPTTDFGLHGSNHGQVIHNCQYGEISEVGKLIMEVRDTGAGMSKLNLEKLFEQFTQFDSTKLQGGGGSGLGLWICRKIMYMLGGRVYAHSDGEGRGSVFVVELPLYCGSPCDTLTFVDLSSPRTLAEASKGYIQVNIQDTDIELAAVKRPPTSWDALKALRFLVVDDSKINRKIVSKLMQTELKLIAPTATFEFIEADDGDVAVDKLKHALESDVEGERIDCVLIDYVMVKMNGPEAVRSMRHDLKYTGLIIGITGNALKEDLDYFESCGCDRALSKPVNSADIIKLCESHILNCTVSRV